MPLRRVHQNLQQSRMAAGRVRSNLMQNTGKVSRLTSVATMRGCFEMVSARHPCHRKLNHCKKAAGNRANGALVALNSASFGAPNAQFI